MKKKILLALAMIMLFSTVAAAKGNEDLAQLDGEKIGFLKMNGSIDKIVEEDGYFAIHLKSATDNNVNFILRVGDTPIIVDTKDGSLKTAADLKKDMKITVFYDVNTPVMLSMPAQFTPDVIAIDSEDGFNIDVDFFNEELEGARHRLAINAYDAKEVYYSDGEKSEDGDFENKNLIVLYRESTRSIPAQTNASKIYFLNSKKDSNAVEYTEMKAEVKKVINDQGHISLEVNVPMDGGSYDALVNIMTKSSVYSDKLYDQIKPDTLKSGDKVTIFYDEDDVYNYEEPQRIVPKVVVLNENEADIDAILATIDEEFNLQGTGIQMHNYDHTNVTFADGKNGEMKDVKNELALVFFEDVDHSFTPAKIKPLKITIMQLQNFKHKIMLGETEIRFNISPIKVDGKELYPVREIFDNANGEVSWNAEDKVITIHLEPDVISIDTVNKTFKVNDDAKKDLNLQIVEGRTYAGEELFK